MRLSLLLLTTVLILAACTYHQPKATITQEWLDENTNKSDCVEIDGQKACAVINPCVIDPNVFTEITQKMLEDCCQPDGTCNFQSPTYTIK